MGFRDEGRHVPKRSRWRRRLGARWQGSVPWSGEPLPLSRLRAGQEGRVAYIATTDGHRLEQLSGLGLLPEAVVRLLQKHPAAVVQVGETEVAIDPAIAQQIYVRPLA